MGRVGLVFGGRSYEHEISIVSAITIKNKLSLELFFIFLDNESNFYEIDSKHMKSSYFKNKTYLKATPLTITKGGFAKKGFMKSELIGFDYVINLIHGGDGEDGKLAGIFEFFDIPFIGPRVEASVISSNKFLTKGYAKEVGVRVFDYQVMRKNSHSELAMGFPVIIKPTHLGSSIGVSVAHNHEEFEFGLDVAFEFDNEVIIEPFVSSIREFNFAGFMGQNGLVFSKIEEPNKDAMLDFDKKYLDFSREQELEESKIPEQISKQIEESFAKIYGSLFEGALIRCDFFYHDGLVYLNEINPIPGSLANYLFSDYEKKLISLSHSLPKYRKIAVDYKYISKIQSAKGKA